MRGGITKTKPCVSPNLTSVGEGTFTKHVTCTTQSKGSHCQTQCNMGQYVHISRYSALHIT